MITKELRKNILNEVLNCLAQKDPNAENCVDYILKEIENISRKELASEINKLAKKNELISVEQYRFLKKKSRSWADNHLTEEEGWFKIKIYNNNYYLKDK